VDLNSKKINFIGKTYMVNNDLKVAKNTLNSDSRIRNFLLLNNNYTMKRDFEDRLLQVSSSDFGK